MLLEKIKICHEKRLYSMASTYTIITSKEAFVFLKNFNSNELIINVEKNKNIKVVDINNSFEIIFIYNKKMNAFNECVQFKNF